MILKIYKNYLKTLRTTRTFYNSFNRSENRLVKIKENLKYLGV